MTQNTNTTNEYTGPTQLTPQQQAIVQDLCITHDLDPSQISFEGKSETPIFDYEAVCALSLKLTDIASIDCRMLPPTSEPLQFGMGNIRISNAECVVTLADGRTRKCVDSAQLGETAGGVVFATPRDADGLAQNRAVRRGIRSVGVNLWRAHLNYKKNGVIASGSTDIDPRAANYREIHVLAEELDLIVEGNRQAYEHFLYECYGKTSSKDLNDLELHQLLVQLRAMASQKRSRDKSAA